ncbi:MAG: helix-turn-helix transcriptional regulator [Lachnospiraceae bacterium]|nr:helix-turn-helix transcriptional regulator [Lachnospiraceae bacterium]
MAVNFEKYFKLAEEKGITYSQILKDANISGNVLTRMRRNEYVSLESIEKICRVLECDITDILEFLSEEEIVNG